MADEQTPNENQTDVKSDASSEPTPTVEQPNSVTPSTDSTSPTPSPLPVVTPEQLSVPGSAGHNGLAIAGLIVGIVAVVSGWIPFWGILVGAAAIVLSIIALKKHEGKGMAIAGIITGAVGALTSIVASIILILGIALSAGVVNTAVKAANDAAAQQAAAQKNLDSAKKDFAKGTTATFYNFEVKANSVKTGWVSSDKYSTPSDGDQFIEVNLTIKNISSDSQFVSENDYEVLADGTAETSAYVDGDSPLLDGDLAAGASTTGDVVFEVPTSATNFKLQFSVAPLGSSDSSKEVTYTLAL